MSDHQTKLVELEYLLNRGSIPQFIFGDIVRKGIVGEQNKYKFVVNSNDHLPAHIHISENNRQIGSYDLESGEVVRSYNPRLDKIVADWLAKEENKIKALREWQRFHGVGND